MNIKKHDCGCKIEKNVQYCPECGFNFKEESLYFEIKEDNQDLSQNNPIKQINLKFCEKCGATLDDNEKSCKLCGMGANERIVSFRNAKIPQFEAKVLEELEQITGKIFTFVRKTNLNSELEFSTFKIRVNEISICYCELYILPKSIKRL